MNSEINAVPPYDTSGSGMPTTGSNPLTIAMLTNAYLKNIKVIAPPMSRANNVDAFAVMTIARFQPSELMKIALPLMLAWYFQKFEGRIGWRTSRSPPC